MPCEQDPHRLNYSNAEPRAARQSQVTKRMLIVLALVFLAIVFFCASLQSFINGIDGLGDH
jgi:hypothetical protein